MTTTAGEPVRILVTGSRHLDESGQRFVWSVVANLVGEIGGRRDVVFVHGAATGVDAAVQAWVNAYSPDLGITAEPHPADWSRGARGGPTRNAEMVDRGAALCLAFPRRDSKGTWGCIRLAANAGIPTRIHPLPKIVTLVPPDTRASWCRMPYGAGHYAHGENARGGGCPGWHP